MKVQELKSTFELSEIRLKEVSKALMLLTTEDSITERTYDYLNDKILYVLRDLVFPFLRGDIKEFNKEKE